MFKCTKQTQQTKSHLITLRYEQHFAYSRETRTVSTDISLGIIQGFYWFLQMIIRAALIVFCRHAMFLPFGNCVFGCIS